MSELRRDGSSIAATRSIRSVGARSQPPGDGLHPGALVLKRYVVERKIAAGAMGEVWCGEHEQLHLKVAIKTLRPHALVVDEIVTRFAREAFLLGQIHSDHVARVLDYSQGGKHGPILVMEFVEGPTLANVLRSRRLSVEEAIDLGIDIGNALRELHAASVVHRDVKPSNIIMRPSRSGDQRAVFVDLGVSRLLDDECPAQESLTEITSADRAVGTIEYMAPEQILSSREVRPSADLYALGAILFRAVTGVNVYGDVRGMSLARLKLTQPPPELDTGRGDRVARGFCEVVSRALERAPEDRYEVADEVLADLQLLRDAARRVAASQTISAATPKVARSLPPKGAQGMKRWAARAAIALAVLCAGAAVGFAAKAHTNSAPPPAFDDVAAHIEAERCVVLSRQTETPAEQGRERLVRFSISCVERP